MRSPGLLIAPLVVASSCSLPFTGVAERTARAPDGLLLSYDVRGEGDTALVFIHCWACDRTFWRHQLDALADDYLVVAVDLAGHGASGVSRPSWSIAGLGADVAAVVDDLRLDRLILIGHSMGGPVALEAARRLPERVRAIVAVDTLHDVDIEYRREQAEEWARGFERDFDAAMTGAIESMLGDADPEVLEWVEAKARQANQAAVIALLRDFPNVDLKRSLSAVRVPVRCINAAPRERRGMVTDIEANRKYADFDAVLLEGVGHYLMLEKPDEFNAELRRVLRSLK